MGLIVLRHIDESRFNIRVTEDREEWNTLLEEYVKDDRFRRTIDGIRERVTDPNTATIYHSGIARSISTAQAVAAGIGYQGTMMKEGRIYDGVPQNLLNALGEDSWNIVVGHLYTMEDSFGVTSRNGQGYHITRGNESNPFQIEEL